MRHSIRWFATLIFATWLAAPVTLVIAQTGSKAAGSSAGKDSPQRHCLILVGLPGDADHATLFRRLTTELYGQLLVREFPRPNVHVLSHQPEENAGDQHSQINEGSIKSTIQDISLTLRPEDSFWLVMIGHADHDGEHARFHIPGPDLRAIDYADLLDDLQSREQVFWLTTSSSGWFTEPLSKENRIVVTATAREPEPNETEFPSSFVKALAAPDEESDVNKDGDVSILELFAKTHQLVEASYQLDQRAPTEHATIEDTADGKATEWTEISAEIERIRQLNASENSNAPNLEPALSTTKVDGRFAATVLVPKRKVIPTAGVPEQATEERNTPVADGVPAPSGE